MKIYEAKTSVSDFYADRRKDFRARPEKGMGNFRYYIAPRGLIRPERLPDGWGLVEVWGRGPRTRVVFRSKMFEASKEIETIVLISFVRRLYIRPGRHVSIRMYGQPVPDPVATAVVEPEPLSRGGNDA